MAAVPAGHLAGAPAGVAGQRAGLGGAAGLPGRTGRSGRCTGPAAQTGWQAPQPAHWPGWMQGHPLSLADDARLRSSAARLACRARARGGLCCGAWRLASRRCATSPLSPCGRSHGCAARSSGRRGLSRWLRSARAAPVAGTAAQRGAQVMSRSREQAGVEHPLGREPGARAAAAERLGDRGDDADLTRAVPVAVTGCDR